MGAVLRAALLAFVLALLVTAPCAAGQPAASDKAPRVELWASVSSALTGPSGQLTSSYSPPALYYAPLVSTAVQTLRFDGSTAAGFQGGGSFFLSRHFGIQAFVDRVSPGVSGPSSPYEVTLQYQTGVVGDPNLPGDTVTIHRSIPWPDSTGSFKQWVTAVNGVVRLGPSGRRISGTLSGGLSYYRMSGTLQSIGFTSYTVGRAFALNDPTPNDVRLALALAPTSAAGFNGGGGIDIRVARNLAATIGYRYMGGPAIDVSTQVASIFVGNQTIDPRFLILDPPPPPRARVSFSSSRLLLGLKWMR